MPPSWLSDVNLEEISRIVDLWQDQAEQLEVIEEQLSNLGHSWKEASPEVCAQFLQDCAELENALPISTGVRYPT